MSSSGIYVIKTSEGNYYGETVDFVKRFDGHIACLRFRSGKRNNEGLLMAFKRGEELKLEPLLLMPGSTKEQRVKLETACIIADPNSLNVRQNPRRHYASSGCKRGPNKKERTWSKFTPEQVAAIIADTRTQKVISEEYGCSVPYISRIKSGSACKPYQPKRQTK